MGHGHLLVTVPNKLGSSFSRIFSKFAYGHLLGATFSANSYKSSIFWNKKRGGCLLQHGCLLEFLWFLSENNLQGIKPLYRLSSYIFVAVR